MPHWSEVVATKEYCDGLSRISTKGFFVTLPTTILEEDIQIGDHVCLDVNTASSSYDDKLLVMRGSIIAKGDWGDTVSCGGLLFRCPNSYPVGTNVFVSVAKVRRLTRRSTRHK